MIKIHQGNEEINSNGGNILIGKLISDIGLEKMNLQTTKRIKHGEIPHSDLVKMAVTLLVCIHEFLLQNKWGSVARSATTLYSKRTLDAQEIERIAE